MDTKSLREEFSRLTTEGQTLLDTLATENRDKSEAEETASAARFSRLEKIKSLLDEQAKFASLKLADDAGDGDANVVLPKEDPGRDAFNASEGKGANGTAAEPKVDRQQFNRALNHWALTGDMARQFATITTATQSGALLPKMVAQPVVVTYPTAFRQAMALYGVQPVSGSSTAEMNLPVVIAAVGSDLSETATSGTQNEPSLTETINLKPAPIQSGQAWVSNLELAALDYDLLGSLVPSLIDAKEMRLEQKAMAAIIADTGITQSEATATISGLTYDNLVDLNNKLATRWDRQKVIILSPAAYTAACKLTGDDGHPVLLKDPQNQTLVRLNGTPVLKSDYLEAFGANKVVGILVSLVGFRLRDAGTQKIVRHLDDKDKVDQTGLNVIGYHAWGYAPSAMVKLKCPAS
ncbi:MAG TPA: phage major capsid protein [Tepidisphaeraceae bacterium]|jgi:HK97 family phage major capsid protein|nr:phage major capsid protein [Tepidisphaeraceae bacterium]